MSSPQAKLFWEALGQERGMHRCLNFASSTPGINITRLSTFMASTHREVGEKARGCKKGKFRVKRYKEGGE